MKKNAAKIGGYHENAHFKSCEMSPYMVKLASSLQIIMVSIPMHSGSLVRFGDFCISLLGNHVLACTSLWGCKVGNIFAKIYSFMTNGSDPLKI